jgi:hypothetical protein
VETGRRKQSGACYTDRARDRRPESAHRPHPRPGAGAANGPGLAALRDSVRQLAARQESVATLAQTVDQLAAGQDRMVHQIDMLQSANQESLEKYQRLAPSGPPPLRVSPRPERLPRRGHQCPTHKRTRRSVHASSSPAMEAGP